MPRSPITSLGIVRVCGLLTLVSLLAGSSSLAKSKAKAKAEPVAEAPAAPAEQKSGAAASAPTEASASPGAAATPVAGTSAAGDPAKADPPRKLSKAEVEEAKTQASAAFQSGKYSEAAEILLRVYDSEPQPLFLFNAGQAYRKGDKPKEAKAAYEQFLQVAPSHKLAPEVQGYVRDMDALLASKKQAQEISLELDKEKAESRFVKQALERERSPIYKKPLFWVALAGGLVAVVTIGLGVFAVQVQGYSDLGNRKVK